MLTMTRQKVPLSGFIKKLKGYDDAEVAAIIEDLDLVPAFMITPSLIKIFRIELRSKAEAMNADKENVFVALAYIDELLNSEYGRSIVQKYRERFNFSIPLNR